MSIEEKSVESESEQQIGVLVDRVGAVLTRLLRLVRPAEAPLISSTVDELEAVLASLLEQVIRQSHLQSAGVFASFLDRLEQLESRITTLEGKTHE